MLCDLGKFFNNNLCCNFSLERNVIRSRFQRYIELVENKYKGHDEVSCAKSLIGLIVEYLNYKEAVEAVEIDSCPEDNSSLYSIYSQLEEKLDLQSAIIAVEEVHKDDEKAYKNAVLLNRPSIEVSVNAVPILLSPWKGERTIDNLIVINSENVFDGVKYSFNIENWYLHPMGIVVCKGGNHSQLSARYKNKGITIINRVIDFTQLYKTVEFNGNSYVKIDDGTVVDLESSENILFYSGVIFELGRYLTGKNYCSVKEISTILNDGNEYTV